MTETNTTTKVSPKSKKESVTLYSRDELIDYAYEFDVRPEVMAGALYGVETASKQEAEKRIKEFLSRGAK